MTKEAVNYSSEFYKSIQSDSFIAAQKVIPILKKTFNPKSVLDVGCGDGTWLRQWGSDIELNGLEGLHSKDLFVDSTYRVDFCDLNLGVPEHVLKKKFDLITCFEVAEHLKSESAELVVSQMCELADVICFSCATPGQGGVAHINERPLAYWKSFYEGLGFNMYDLVRPQIQMKQVAPWYKYNTFVYVKRNSTIEDDLKHFLVKSSADIKNFEPSSYRIRKAILSLLPVSIVTQMALIKHRFKSNTVNH